MGSFKLMWSEGIKTDFEIDHFLTIDHHCGDQISHFCALFGNYIGLKEALSFIEQHALIILSNSNNKMGSF